MIGGRNNVNTESLLEDELDSLHGWNLKMEVDAHGYR